jgi:2,4-dienoyl-CoA reductase-like NADH-dependent reductase (Old Yellow Enzyme family)
MDLLFQPFEFCGMQLKNRFVRSATMENLATPDKLPSEDLMQLYEKLARGDVGLIITSAVRPDRRWDPAAESKNMCLDQDDQLPAFSRLVDRIHAFESRVTIQLGSFYRYEGDFVLPSVLARDRSSKQPPRALEKAEIRRIIMVYAEAGERAWRAGFDAVQLNAAHGFPLSRFLSPFFNRRDDEYGGNPENRARIILEISAEIRKRTHGDYPVFIKMNVADFCNGGMTVDDALEIAKICSQNGISAIETSGGTADSTITQSGHSDPSKWQEGYFLDYAAAIKAAVDIPIILVGGLRNPRMMVQVVEAGKVDLVSMSRPFIKEPHIVKRWRDGDRAPAYCISCDGCLEAFLSGEPLRCVTE